MNKLMTICSYLSALLLVGVVSLGAPTLLAQQGARAKQRATNKNAPDDDEVDHVNLAAMLVSDGYYDRAAAVLSKLSAEDVPPERLGRYHLLMGLIQLDSRAYEAAIDSLSAAIEHGQHQDVIFVYLAQCYDGLGDHKMTVHSIDAAGDAGKASPGLLLIKANALLKLGEKVLAWGALADGVRAFPEEPEFLRQQTFLLVDLGLYRAAGELGARYLAQIEPTPDDYRAIATTFSESQQHERALEILERGALEFPDDVELRAALARAYTAKGMLMTGGDLLQFASERDAELVGHSSELFRRAGSLSRAMYMNSMMTDQTEKFRQRASILLDQERFSEVVGMSKRLERVGLLEDQNILYALAYAHFKTGEYDGAEVYIKLISDPKLFEHATQLRQVISRCEQDPDACG